MSNSLDNIVTVKVVSFGSALNRPGKMNPAERNRMYKSLVLVVEMEGKQVKVEPILDRLDAMRNQVMWVDITGNVPVSLQAIVLNGKVKITTASLKEWVTTARINSKFRVKQ